MEFVVDFEEKALSSGFFVITKLPNSVPKMRDPNKFETRVDMILRVKIELKWNGWKLK